MDSGKATVAGAEKPAGADAARGRAVIAACSLLTLVFGSVHAFSVLLTGLETTLHRDRAAVSLTYSLALAALTLAVLAGLAAPWFSASLFDATGSYALPLEISALVSVASSLTALAFL